MEPHLIDWIEKKQIIWTCVRKETHHMDWLDRN